MINAEQVLKAREERITNIKNLKTDGIILLIKANIPGLNKNVKEAFVLTRIFKKIISNNYNIENDLFFESHDGPYYLLSINAVDVKEFKLKMIDLEDNHSLGRLIDLDVFLNSHQSISRLDLKEKKRRCFLCEQDATHCIRLSSHDLNESYSYIKTMVDDYLIAELEEFLKLSFLDELNLDPKFGLVTPKTNGSHQDMNYNLMIAAINAIIPGLLEMFKLGYNYSSIDLAFQEARIIGLKAEKEMLKATNGVNAYKGAIFNLGIVLVSLGNLLKNNLSYENLYSNIAYISRDLLNELDDSQITNGVKIYKELGITGARGEAYTGMRTVQTAVDYLNSYSEINQESLLMTLIYIINAIDDTVMIKRSGSWDNYLYYKKLIFNIKEFDLEKANQITKIMIDNSISCGGSADLLITTVFIKKVFDELI